MWLLSVIAADPAIGASYPLTCPLYSVAIAITGMSGAAGQLSGM